MSLKDDHNYPEADREYPKWRDNRGQCKVREAGTPDPRKNWNFLWALEWRKK